MVYSDGFSDNIPEEEFSACLRKSLLEDDPVLGSISGAADCQARKAYARGKKTDVDSPFAIKARKAGLNYTGGKHDDISVIVA